MNPVAVYGKLHHSLVFISFFEYSIIMEYSDGGDLFQKITNHQK